MSLPLQVNRSARILEAKAPPQARLGARQLERVCRPIRDTFEQADGVTQDRLRAGSLLVGVEGVAKGCQADTDFGVVRIVELASKSQRAFREVLRLGLQIETAVDPGQGAQELGGDLRLGGQLGFDLLGTAIEQLASGRRCRSVPEWVDALEGRDE